MNELIPIASTVIGGQAVPTCDARELHAFLQNGDMFANWIRDRITKYGFVEGIDYVSFLVDAKKPRGGRPSKEYALTLRMAKHLGMAENNAQGMLVRDYFLLCEQRAQHSALLAAWNIPKDYRGALMLAADLAGQVETQQAELAAAEPKVAAYDRYMDSTDDTCLSEIGKKLQQPPRKLLDRLVAAGFLYRLNKRLVPHQQWIDRGLFVVITKQVGEKDRNQTYATARGMLYLAEWLRHQQGELNLRPSRA